MYSTKPTFSQYYDLHKQQLVRPVESNGEEPVKLGKFTPFQWDQKNQLREDNCTVTIEEKESQRPGTYQLSGYDPSFQYVNDYIDRMDQPTHFQKVYRNPHAYVDDESYLWLSELNNMRYINQLYTRPYAGFYCGPGMPSLGQKDLESALQQGLLTNLRQKPCESCRGKSMYRFQCLPDFGNPQKESHVIPPPVHLGGWIRGGVPSRDFVRRIDYQRRCADQMNTKDINKGPVYY